MVVAVETVKHIEGAKYAEAAEYTVIVTVPTEAVAAD